MPINPTQFQALVNIYQGEIDSLIENLGKPVTIFFKEKQTTSVDNEDSVRGTDSLKPDYKNPQIITRERETTTILALLKINPEDFKRFDLPVNDPSAILRVKTYASHIPDLKRCDFIKPHSDDLSLFDAKYKLVREPIPVGLKYNRYCISFWERVT